MSNPQTVQLSNPYAVKSRKIGTDAKAARKKQDEDKLARLETEMARNDWEASAYYNDATGAFFIPDSVIIACIRSGATVAKRGRDIDRACIVNEEDVQVGGVPKHKNLDGYWSDKSFHLSGPAKIPPKTGALIWKTRCMMPTGWTLEFSVDYDEGLIEEKTLIEAIKTAGAICGIGGWRPKFGRFETEVIADE
jgi:hypothetical protein